MVQGVDDSGTKAATLDVGSRIVVLFGGGIAALPIMAIASVLPQIGQALAHSPGDGLLVRQLIGGVGLAMVVGAALVGVLIERLGLRRVLIGAALFYVVAGTAGLYLDDLYSLLASRLLLGVAAATIQVSCITIVNTRLTEAGRARWMGLHISSAMAITIVVHPIAGALGMIGWRWPFALYALGLCLIPAALYQQPAPRSVASVTDPTMPTGRLRDWLPVRFMLLGLVIGSVVFSTSVYVPFLLHDRGMSNPAQVALVLTADSLAGVLMATTFGAARRRLSARQAFVVSFSASAIGTMIAWTAPNLVVLIAGLLIYGAGVGWFVPNLMSSLAGVVPAGRQGSAAGVVKASHYLAAPLSVALAEPIARQYGTPAVFGAVAAICLVMAVIFSSFRVRPTPALATAKLD